MRERRIGIGQTQEEAARQLGVSVWTVINWELGETQPGVERGPKIIEFLDYDPLPEPRTFGEEVWKLRWRSGLTQRELARRLSVNESTIRDWERGAHEPSPRLRRVLGRLPQQIDASGSAAQ